jgi:hypothetical protein
MEKENLPNLPRSKSALRSVILESQKIRSDRGEDFFNNKKLSPEEIAGPKPTSKIHCLDENSKTINTETDFKKLRETHLKLSHLIVDYDKKIFDQNNQVSTHKKSRSKSIHLYIDEKIEHFLNTESEKVSTKWGLRKNAGLGSLISKFLENFIELKKREERQLKKVKKIIDDFRSNLVEFKKNSSNPDDYQNAERANQKMKVLSNDLRILLSLLEFEEDSLKKCLADDFNWLDFIIRWKFQS